MKKLVYGSILFAHYVIDENRFGISFTFKTEDDFAFSSKDKYIVNMEGSFSEKEKLLHKIFYCLKETKGNELKDLNNKKIKMGFEDDEFYDFWFIKEDK